MMQLRYLFLSICWAADPYFSASSTNVSPVTRVIYEFLSRASLVKAIEPTQTPPAENGPTRDSLLRCFDLTYNDRVNRRYQRMHPGVFFNPIEFYAFRNASCVWAGHTPEFRVWCQKIRSGGRPILDGEERQDLGNCKEGTVCVRKLGELNLGSNNGQRPPDIECVDREKVREKRLLRANASKKWCSNKYPVDDPNAQKRAQYIVTIELSPRTYGAHEVADLWFEIVTDWWRFEHRFAERVGDLTSGIITTAPALGRTYVKYCALLTSETVSKALPYVTILYTMTAINTHGRINDFRNSAALYLDVMIEPVKTPSRVLNGLEIH